MQELNLGNGNIAYAEKVATLDPALFKRIVDAIGNRTPGQQTIANAPLNKIVLYTAAKEMYDADIHNAYDVESGTVFLHICDNEVKMAIAKHPVDIKVVPRAMLLISEFNVPNKTYEQTVTDRKNYRALAKAFKDEKITELKVYDDFLQDMRGEIIIQIL